MLNTQKLVAFIVQVYILKLFLLIWHIIQSLIIILISYILLIITFQLTHFTGTTLNINVEFNIMLIFIYYPEFVVWFNWT